MTLIASRPGLWGGRLGNRRLYPEPHRRPVAVLNKCERVIPRLCRDSQSLTVPGVGNSLQSMNRSKFNGKETVHGGRVSHLLT